MDIDLSSLIVFRHLAECKSFTETGKRWNISQPTVSQIVNRLESTTGIILLDRSGSQTSLTPDGLIFLERVNEVCTSYLEFIDQMAQIGRRMDHQVTIGIDQSWFGKMLYAVSDKLKHPAGVTPIFSEISGEAWSLLDSGRLDIIVACRFLRNGISTSIQEAIIRRESGITIAWNPQYHHFDPERFKFPDILRTNVLIPGPSQIPNFEQTLHQWCQFAYGMPPANTEAFNSEHEAAQAAAAGLGVFIAPGDAIPRLGIEGQGLAHVKIFKLVLPESLTLGVYCRSDETNKEVMSTAAQVGRLCMTLFPEA